MNKKTLVSIVIIAVVIVVGVAVINPRWEVNELLKEVNFELGSVTGYIIRGQAVGQLNKGDELKISGSLVGDPVDFSISRMTETQDLEVARWKFTSPTINDISWIVPEKDEYMLHFQSNGEQSEVHIFVYRRYVKSLFPW